MAPIDIGSLLVAQSQMAHRRRWMIRRISVIRRLQRMSEPTPRRFWIRKILQDFHLGSFNSDIRDYHDWDQKYFFDYFRMNKTTFQQLLGMVGADIEKKATKMHNPISAAERLCMTVRFLSTGQSQQEIA